MSLPKRQDKPPGGDASELVASQPASSIAASSSALPSQSAGSSSTASTAGSGSGTTAACDSKIGAIVGAAVGGAAAAAILTFLICFLFFRKKNQRDRNRGPSAGNLSSHNEKALPKSPTAATGFAWQKHLPQSADDRTVRSAVKTLFDQVELHVENFYQDTSVQVSEQLQDSLAQINSPHLPETAVTLLPRARSQLPILKHCLLSYITASISTDDTSTQSLLPKEFSEMPRLIRERGTDRKPVAFDQALSHWRVLTSYLRPAPKSDPLYLTNRDTIISSAASAFSAAFTPWAKPAYSESARRNNIVEIFKSGSETGVLVFAQPSTYQFQWVASSVQGGQGSSAAGGGELVVVPAFVKVADENADSLNGKGRGQVMVESVTANVGAR